MKTALPKMVPEAVFIDFLSHLRSKPFLDRFWEGPALENDAPTTAGARFWQNHDFHVLLAFSSKMESQIDDFCSRMRAGTRKKRPNCKECVLFGSLAVVASFAAENHDDKWLGHWGILPDTLYVTRVPGLPEA